MNEKIKPAYITFETGLGWLLVAQSPGGIALVRFLGEASPSQERVMTALEGHYPGSLPLPETESHLLKTARASIRRYLEKREPIPGIALDLSKASPFDRIVWDEIQNIAFGQARSYGQIAAKTGRVGASRAVGRACGRNPVPILIPCHRVVSSGGKLGGYSGGLAIKRTLLEMEGSLAEDLLHRTGSTILKSAKSNSAIYS
ncbi:MAG: methylated-DNA--[protein]-cysteine S-methyltransferase [Syntrophobacteraceae bacterium]